MDRDMFSYPFNTADMHDASAAPSSYELQAFIDSSGMASAEPSQNPYLPQRRDSQNSYISPNESIQGPHHALPSPPALPSHTLHSHSNSSSSSSSAGPRSRRQGSPNSPLNMDLPLPYPQPRSRRSPNQRILPLPEDFDDDSDDEPLPPDASEKEKSEWRKRRNTKAARRSRKRKVLYTERLEASVAQLRLEKETWRTRALTLRQLLKSHSLPCPDFED
ncbi:hypothetical protein BDP27DRAFT_1341678 [Rhodocollybia butyracea]|uniref:BZIP domain-containing protein n=1 Tax=Rhodocollybia butyracea TaxID=206335 RepID=A0A9P5P6T5_9AGAR|nr:hypothetical protein BDP27DRAFT_1341678 [Rhodocollybia butyracea]